MPQVIAVFGASQTQPGDADYEAAVEVGRLLAEAGFTVATGGYAGVMEAAAIGAAKAGGDTIGFTAPQVFPGRSGANDHIDTEIPSETLGLRINNMMEACSGFIVMPGSIGTLTELMLAWNSAFVSRFSGAATKPIATVGEPWLTLVPQLTSSLDTDGTLVTCHDEAADAVGALVTQLA